MRIQAMEFVVISCGGCGAAVRICHPEQERRRFCPLCGAQLFLRPRLGVDRRLVASLMVAALAGVLIVACWAIWPSRSAAPIASAIPDSAISDSASAPSSPPLPAVATQARPGASVPEHTGNALPGTASNRCPLASSGDTILAMPKTEQATSGLVQDRGLSGPRPVDSSSQRSPRPPVPIRQASARTAEPGPSSEPAAAGRPAESDPGPAPPIGGQFRVKDERGEPVVARLHGRWGGKSVLILPDGQLGIPNMLIPTNEPFRSLTADELLPRLQQGPLGDFQVLRTSHYLIFYKSSQGFAEASGRLLEDLYRRLLDAFRKNQVAVHDAEFPLVAVIYRTEREFRTNQTVEPVVQAFYEIYTNRITFYEISDQDASAPEISALRKPQTVAHEGTHQILQNIGVHPRLSSWPIWLVEGLAEYCATPATARKGGRPVWDGLGMINGLHMATIRELGDPLSVTFQGDNSPVKCLVREPGKPLVESLVRKTRLTPTEYSLAWAMTHYLAFKRQDDFVAYLKRMSQLAPLEPRTPDEHLADFKSAFGRDLVKLDRAIDVYLRWLDTQRKNKFDRMPFYAVMYEQVVPTGLVRRARVSQSPQVIWQWVQEVTVPQGAQPTWQAIPHDTRSRALRAVQEWMHGSG
jgi:Protein of unknown function (DUF1570)